MLIKLNQSEIEEGLKMYVAAQGIDLGNKNVSIDFTNSRGPDGLTADFNIVLADATPAAPTSNVRSISETKQVEQAGGEGEVADTTAGDAVQTETVAETDATEPAEVTEEDKAVPAKSLFG